jgi:predicted Zn-ribbon and HTH transcriptional regulator
VSIVTTSRPIQPSMRKEMAQQMALLDPRCGFESHNRVTLGEQCPRCHLDLWSYLEVVPQVWP